MKDWAASSVLSLALVVALVALGFLGLDAVVRNLRQERADDRLANAVASANAVNQAVAAHASVVDTAATGLSPWSGSDQDRAHAFTELQRLATEVPDLAGGLVILDRDGTIVATDRARERLVGVDVSGPHVQRAAAGETAISPVVDDPLDGESTLQVAAPMRDAAADVTATLVSFEPVESGVLARALGRVAPPPDTELVLVGPQGAVVTRPGGDGTADLGQEGLATEVPATAADHGSGTVEYAGEGGLERFAAYAPVTGGWAVVQYEERANLDALPRQVRLVGAVVAVLIVGAVVVAVALVERRRHAAIAEAENAKRSMLAVAGHELRTPLTVVRGMATTAKSRWEALDDERKLGLISTIDRQARTLDHLVERLLYAAHLEAGVAGTVDRRPVDVVSLSRQAVEHHAQLARLHEFSFEADDESLRAVADPKALDQVLFHLLDNAAKYTPSGGGIGVAVEGTRRGVRITVEDDGIGLPADTSRLFDAFTQNEDVDTRTHDEGGVGLGLYIVRSLVELMGGAVRAEPAESGGARIVVTLARTRADEPVTTP